MVTVRGGTAVTSGGEEGSRDEGVSITALGLSSIIIIATQQVVDRLVHVQVLGSGMGTGNDRIGIPLLQNGNGITHCSLQLPDDRISRLAL